MGRFSRFTTVVFLAAVYFASAALPAAESAKSATAPATVDLAIAPKSAIESATKRFEESAGGRQCLARMRNADARRDKALAGGSDDERRQAALERMTARSAYRMALKAALERDPLLREAAEQARLAAAPPPATQPTLSLNQQVLAFAEAHLGQQVGNGECWTLADDAFKEAHTTHPDVYVWGTALANDEPPIPGDIIQFTSVHLEDGNRWMNIGTPHHTAVIRAVDAPGTYTVLQQNFGGKTVSAATFDLTKKTAGEFIIYRPGPKAERGAGATRPSQ